MPFPTPPRRRGAEHIDDPTLDPAVVVRSLHDVARSNTLFGGRRALLTALAPALADAAGRPLTLLDVGTGLGDIPRHARRQAARRGVALTAFGVELNFALAAASRAGTDASLCADAFALPFPDRSIDVVTASQVAHHFEAPDLARLFAELDRVARRLVVVGDLRRSYLAAGGFWIAARALGFHAVTRHDGVLSVFRGFTADELAGHVRAAVPAARDLDVRHRLGWRVVASWRPALVTPPVPAARAGREVGAAPAAPLRRPSPLLG